MKIGIVGSRSFKNLELLKKEMKPFLNRVSLIVSGGAKGADEMAEEWAVSNKIDTEIFYPEFKSFGRGAYRMRNIEIVRNADLIIAFWDGKSKGTDQTIGIAKKSGVPVMIVKY